MARGMVSIVSLICDDCGSYVADEALHVSWHEANTKQNENVRDVLAVLNERIFHVASPRWHKIMARIKESQT